jgi:pimeloyl-ACP methyl ester carboxylesterase
VQTEVHDSKVVIGAVNIHYKLAGAGDRVLLLHGWGGSIDSWLPVTKDLLAKSYQVLAIDFPGFGESDPPPGPWGVPEYTISLAELLERLEFYPTHVVAHSFGGRVAIMLAAERPELVNKLVLVAGAGVRIVSPRVRVVRALTKTVKTVFTLPGLSTFRPRVQSALNRRFASSDYQQAGELRETFVKVINQDLRDYARRIKAPTLLVWGDKDTETPIVQAQILNSCIPDSGLVVLQGGGHYAYLEQFVKFSIILNQFLGH